MSTRRERAKEPTKQLNKQLASEQINLNMGLILLFFLIGVFALAYFIYDMHNQKKIERGYWLL